MLTATLFDMDGLLVDSEILWHKAEVEILGALGVTPIFDNVRYTKGMFVAQVVEHWFARFAWNGPSCDEVVAQILQRVGDLVESEGVLLPGALRAIELAAARGPVAVASSTPMPLIRRTLGHFGLLDHFGAICSADVEPFGKPHPGVFISAATALGQSPRDCLIFEDSAAGVIAAAAATATIVAVPTAEDRDLPAFALASLVLNSLDELDEAWLDEKFAR
jgi:sugar-phosphatase